MTDGFKAATWNVFVLTPTSELEPTLDHLIKDNVTIILNQEAGGTDIKQMYKQRGWKIFTYGQNAVAWDPEVWVMLETKGIRLSKQEWFGDSKDTPKFADAASVRLGERGGKRTMKALSYHLPPHVQYKESRNVVANRVRALHESMDTIGQIVEKARTDALLFGGDDNVDENQGYGSDSRMWDFMRKSATGLRLVQAPRGTLGNRRIDDFRVKGLEPGDGYTLNNASDHDLHARKFFWK